MHKSILILTLPVVVTEEVVDPNGNALRSEQSTNDQTMQAPAKGIPGAVANTPPESGAIKRNSDSIRRQSRIEIKFLKRRSRIMKLAGRCRAL